MGLVIRSELSARSALLMAPLFAAPSKLVRTLSRWLTVDWIWVTSKLAGTVAAVAVLATAREARIPVTFMVISYQGVINDWVEE